MKIPSDAKCVFKGVIFDVYQWQQEMFDGSSATFEMLKRPNTVEVIAIQDEKIYLSKQSQPNKKDFFSPFGGRAEENEEPIETAKRELLEESGFASDDWELLKVYEPSHKIEWAIYLFVARNCKKIGEQNLDAGEKIETKSYSFEEFINIILYKNFWGDELILDVLRMKDQGKLEEFRQKLLK